MLGCAWDVTVGVWGLIWALICSYDHFGPLSRPVGVVYTWFKRAHGLSLSRKADFSRFYQNTHLIRPTAVNPAPIFQAPRSITVGAPATWKRWSINLLSEEGCEVIMQGEAPLLPRTSIGPAMGSLVEGGRSRMGVRRPGKHGSRAATC